MGKWLYQALMLLCTYATLPLSILCGWIFLIGIMLKSFTYFSMGNWRAAGGEWKELTKIRNIFWFI